MIGSIAAECIAALEPEARHALAALALFPPSPNTFSEMAAVAVSDAPIDTLSTFVLRGLLERTETSQYVLHPLIAGIARNSATQDEGARQKFAAYFAQYADTHRDEPRALAAETHNIMAAFGYGSPQERTVIALALSRFLEFRGDYVTWQRLLTEAAPPDQATSTTLELERARVSEKLGNNAEAAQHAVRGLGSAEVSSTEAAKLLGILGHVEMNMGKLHDSHRHLTRAVELSETIGDPAPLSQALRSLGVVATRLAQYNEAQRSLDRALALACEANDIAGKATLWTDIGILRLHQGDLPGAITAARTALDAADVIGFSEKKVAALEALGGMLIRCQEYGEAEKLLTAALRIAREIDHRWYIAVVLNQRGNLRLARNDLDQALQDFDEAFAASPQEANDIRGLALFGAAKVYAARGDYDRATSRASQARIIFERMGHHAAGEVNEWLLSNGRAAA